MFGGGFSGTIWSGGQKDKTLNPWVVRNGLMQQLLEGTSRDLRHLHRRVARIGNHGTPSLDGFSPARFTPRQKYCLGAPANGKRCGAVLEARWRYTGTAVRGIPYIPGTKYIPWYLLYTQYMYILCRGEPTRTAVRNTPLQKRVSMLKKKT